ncbi:hypothetical protein [Desulfocurvus sp. DL9XJH121]
MNGFELQRMEAVREDVCCDPREIGEVDGCAGECGPSPSQTLVMEGPC